MLFRNHTTSIGLGRARFPFGESLALISGEGLRRARAIRRAIRKARRVSAATRVCCGAAPVTRRGNGVQQHRQRHELQLQTDAGEVGHPERIEVGQ